MITLNVTHPSNFNGQVIDPSKIENHVYDDSQYIPVLGRFGHTKYMSAKDVDVKYDQLIINGYARVIIHFCQT